MKYIPKAKLIAEIEFLLKSNDPYCENAVIDEQRQALNNVYHKLVHERINEILSLTKECVKHERPEVDLVAELKHHLDTTPKEKLEKEWKELEPWENIGPTIHEFLYGKHLSPELSDFEKAVGLEIFDEPFDEKHIKVIKEESAKLLSIARKELEPKIKAEALITRATELTKDLAKSGLDKDSIPYHLIEFMCNLYICKNWKEIEETADAYVTRIKAAALKDLPRWGSNLKSSMVDKADVIGLWLYYKEHRIRISDLEKLPGFNE